MADKLITIETYYDLAEASMDQQLLEDFGIKSVITGQNAANMYPLPAVATIKLQVFEDEAQKALDILNDKNRQEED